MQENSRKFINFFHNNKLSYTYYYRKNVIQKKMSQLVMISNDYD